MHKVRDHSIVKIFKHSALSVVEISKCRLIQSIMYDYNCNRCHEGSENNEKSISADILFHFRCFGFEIF